MDLVLSPAELQMVTGYKRPSDQLRELHAMGFYRARRGRVTGKIILERAHYDAVCSGGGAVVAQATPTAPRPKVRAPTLRAVR